MPNRVRLIIGMLVALVTAATAVVGPVQSASAAGSAPIAAAESAYGCSGNRIAHIAVQQIGGTTIYGYLDIYYSGGTNCAVFVVNSNVAGREVGVGIARCSQTSPTSNTCTRVSGTTSTDFGYFSSYAGPVTVYAPNNCIGAYAVVASGDTLIARGKTGGPYVGPATRTNPWPGVGAQHCG